MTWSRAALGAWAAALLLLASAASAARTLKSPQPMLPHEHDDDFWDEGIPDFPVNTVTVGSTGFDATATPGQLQATMDAPWNAATAGGEREEIPGELPWQRQQVVSASCPAALLPCRPAAASTVAARPGRRRPPRSCWHMTALPALMPGPGAAGCPAPLPADWPAHLLTRCCCRPILRV
jgi:hypothetical protein